MALTEVPIELSSTPGIVDNSTGTAITIDASSNVGIGTASPSALLHISKTLAGSDTSAINIQNFGIFTWGLGIDNAVSNSSLLVQSGGIGGTTRLAIDNSGNVGIGTDSPLVPLHVKSTSTCSIIIDSDLSSQQYEIGNGYASAGVNNLYFYDNTAAATRMVIDASGNVGIGRSSIDQPSAGATTLAIQGTDNNKAGAIRLYSADDSVAAYIYPDSTNGLSINTSTSHPMIFRTVGVERMRIDTSGNVGIGTGGDNPTALFEVEAASNPEISIASSAGSTSNFLNFKAISHTQQIQTQLKTIDNGDFTADLAFLFKASGTGGALGEKARLTANGNLLVGKTASSVAGQSNSIQSNTMVSTSGPLNSNTTSAGVFEFNGNKVAIRAYGATAGTGLIAFNVGGGGGSPDSEAMRITSDGELLLNTTGNVGGSQFETKAPSNKHSRSIDSNSGITGSEERAVMAEGTVTANTTSLGTVLSIPFFSQSSVWRRYIIEFMFSSGEYNDSGNGKAGTATVKLASLSTLSGVALLHSTGNVSSVGSSGMNLQITFSSGFTGGLSNFEGVQVYYKILGEVPGYCQIWNATLN